jgi:hypothetical protein
MDSLLLTALALKSITCISQQQAASSRQLVVQIS